MLGNNILFPDYIKREMQRIQFKAKDADWGLGFSITVTPEDKIVGHGGGYPGFITRSGLIQEKKIIIIVLTNAIDGPAITLFDGIKNILNQLDKKKKELCINQKVNFIKNPDPQRNSLKK